MSDSWADVVRSRKLAKLPRQQNLLVAPATGSASLLSGIDLDLIMGDERFIAVASKILGALLYEPGTGGIATEILIDDQTSSNVRIEGTQKRFRTVREDPPASAMVATIRSALGLTVRDLAGVLAVERPTVYSWAGGDSEPSQANRDRLVAVYRIARDWVAAAGTGRRPNLRGVVVEGVKSLLDCMKEDPLREWAISETLRRHAREEVPATTRLNLRERAEALGIPIDDGDTEAVDIFTGQRLGPEE